MKIDKTIYNISENNYIKKESNKDLIILGDTCRSESNHIKRMYLKDNKKSLAWNTYTISRNGEIYEHFDPIYYSEFTDDYSINKRSISILIENMNLLYIDNGEYLNWMNEKCETDVLKKQWKGGYFWEKYTTNQYDSLIYLLKYLFEEFKDIPKEFIDFNHYDSDLLKYKGILCRSNIFKNEYDLNPSFDYEYVMKNLK